MDRIGLPGPGSARLFGFLGMNATASIATPREGMMRQPRYAPEAMPDVGSWIALCHPMPSRPQRCTSMALENQQVTHRQGASRTPGGSKLIFRTPVCDVPRRVVSRLL